MMGCAKCVRNPIVLLSWMRLALSGLSIIIAMGIRARCVDKYVRLLRRTVGRAGRGTTWALT
jgi:hypothetical protein